MRAHLSDTGRMVESCQVLLVGSMKAWLHDVVAACTPASVHILHSAHLTSYFVNNSTPNGLFEALVAPVLLVPLILAGLISLPRISSSYPSLLLSQDIGFPGQRS